VSDLPRPNRVQSWLIGLAALSYAVGYPVALIADLAVGWVLVSVGGLFLLALGVVTIRRATQSERSGTARHTR
jgi:hypothetical protein